MAKLNYSVAEYPREGSGEWSVFCDSSRQFLVFGSKEDMTKKASELNDAFPVKDEIKKYETGLTYNEFKKEKLPNGMYIGMFHGRKTPDEEVEGWGFNGPVIGPLKWVHTTYRDHIRFCHVDDHDGVDLTFFEDMLMYDGKYYGDFTVFLHNQNKEHE